MAKANNVELEIVDTEPAKGLSEEYLKLNALGKVPTFVGADGYVLHEAIAIAIYSKSLADVFFVPHYTPTIQRMYYDEANCQQLSLS